MPNVGETALGGSREQFPTTHWSTLLSSDPNDDDLRQACMEHLIRAYWRPVYAYIRRARAKQVEEAKDITQDFFLSLLERDTLRAIDRTRGRFRNFLKTCLRNYLADRSDRERAQKRGGGKVRQLLVDLAQAPAEALPQDASPEEIFEREWARTVLEQALEEVKAELFVEGRTMEAEVLLALHPLSEGGRLPTYDELAARLGTDVRRVKNALSLGRERLRKAIEDRVRSYCADEADCFEEIADLFGALGS